MTAKNVGGRPEHRPSLKDRRVVTLLAGLGVSQEAIAATLGVAKKTMAKHYHEELRDGAAKVEAQLVGNLFRMAGGDGPVALRACVFLLGCRFGWSIYAPPRPAEMLGKKEALQRDVEDGPDEGTEWADLLLQ